MTDLMLSMKSTIHSLKGFPGSLTRPDSKPRTIQPPTPVRFPRVDFRAGVSSDQVGSLVPFLQSIQRPADIKPAHFGALRLHVTPDATAEDIIPWTGFLPSAEQWESVSQDHLSQADEASRVPLNNGTLSPGIQTYRERQKELLTDNTAAFRTVRRLQPPAGESAARLGNAYEFFKNLELYSGYWPDTSLDTHVDSNVPSSSMDDIGESNSTTPRHMQLHVPVGNGAQVPADYRTQLLHSFVKLVAYPFGCNVAFARTEPRLHLTPPFTTTNSAEASHETKPKRRRGNPPSHFNSSATFIYRTPTDRASARTGIAEGPLAVLSGRASHTFTLPSDHNLDFARELVAILLTAQQRSRKNKTERRFGENEWWTTVPRWGGGPGGPIGREAEARAEAEKALEEGVASGKGVANAVNLEARRLIGGINPHRPPSPSPPKRSKKSLTSKGNMQIYENYRRMQPPSSSWDAKCRYEAIGKVDGSDYDDIFLISSLNHHVSIVRARVPDKLVQVLEGEDEGDGWGKFEMWRTKWFDLYQGKERVEAMNIIWGMTAWLMRGVEAGTG